MYHHGRESWGDALFWGVTLALGAVAVLMELMIYFQWWVPGS